MSEEKRDIKGIWIPIEIWEDPGLTPFERMLLSEIDSLDSGNGCYKSRERLAKRMGCSIGHIKNSVSKLANQKWLFFLVLKGRKALRTRFSRHSDVTYTLPQRHVKVTHESRKSDDIREYREKDTRSNEVRSRATSNGSSFNLNKKTPVRQYQGAPKLVELFYEYLVKINHHINRSDLPRGISEQTKKRRRRTFDTWEESANLLLFQEQGNLTKVKNTITWYFDNRRNTKAFLPVCNSLTTFYESFDKIEIQMLRLNPNLQSSQESKSRKTDSHGQLLPDRNGWV